MADDVTLGEVNRNVMKLTESVNALTQHVQTQNGSVADLKTRVAVLEAIGPPTPSKAGPVVIGLSGAGVGAVVASLVPVIKKVLGY